MSMFTVAEATQDVEEEIARSYKDFYVDEIIQLYYSDFIECWEDCQKAIKFVLDPTMTKKDKDLYLSHIRGSIFNDDTVENFERYNV